jgi:hypothetical protein
MPPLEFTDVLYVPALCGSLFSVCFLTLHCSFTISIERDPCTGQKRIDFQTKTGASTAAYLVGDTIPVEESAL